MSPTLRVCVQVACRFGSCRCQQLNLISCPGLEDFRIFPCFDCSAFILTYPCPFVFSLAGLVTQSSPTSPKEVTEVVEKLQNGRALGVDEIRLELIKALDAVGLCSLTHLYNIRWIWLICWVTHISKNSLCLTDLPRHDRNRLHYKHKWCLSGRRISRSLL